MALTATRISKMAASFVDLAAQLKSVLVLIDEELKYNSDQAANWGVTDGTIITVDGKGNLTGFDFTPAAVSNAIGSFQQIANLLHNQAASQGDHLGNLDILANPSG